MKLSLLIGGAVGYVLGAKAGRERYEAIVRTARTFAGSQTVQSTAGVLGAQVGSLAAHARDLIPGVPGASHGDRSVNDANGYRH